MKIRQLFCKHLVRSLFPGEIKMEGGNIAFFKCILCDKRFGYPPLIPKDRWLE